MTDGQACLWATSTDVYASASYLSMVIVAPWLVLGWFLLMWSGYRLSVRLS